MWVVVAGLFGAFVGELIYQLAITFNILPDNLQWGVVGWALAGASLGGFMAVMGLITESSITQYAALYFALRRTGLMPTKLTRFLEYASSRAVLRRVSGGYRFLHPLLRDYFAAQRTSS
jgi:hypothetical protein